MNNSNANGLRKPVEPYACQCCSSACFAYALSLWTRKGTGVRENGVFFCLQVGGNRRFLRHTRWGPPSLRLAQVSHGVRGCWRVDRPDAELMCPWHQLPLRGKWSQSTGGLTQDWSDGRWTHWATGFGTRRYEWFSVKKAREIWL